MATATGTMKCSRYINGTLTLVEYVRDYNGTVYMRTLIGRSKGKWTHEGSNELTESSFRGESWCTHPTVLEFVSKYKLPKK